MLRSQILQVDSVREKYFVKKLFSFKIKKIKTIEDIIKRFF